MNLTISLAASALYYPKGGGHLWAYLNWALGFKSIGCNVIWLEGVYSQTSTEELQLLISDLKVHLSLYGLSNSIALWQFDGAKLPQEKLGTCIDIESAAQQSDLLLNQQYDMRLDILRLFQRTALLDIDPGLLQMWVARGIMNIMPHDMYFTIGERIKPSYLTSSSSYIHWRHTPPCVSLEWWPVFKCKSDSPFTTISHWYSGLWEEDNGILYSNDKRDSFLPFLNLPQYTSIPLELSIYLGERDQHDREMLKKIGWLVSDSQHISSTPLKYQQYIQQSRGEFSCAKPAYLRLQNAWISDRTICYLASGKPVVVQNTGNSSYLPENEGMLRFNNLPSAIKCLKEVETNYAKHCTLARSMAEEYFDGSKVTTKLLEQALT